MFAGEHSLLPQEVLIHGGLLNIVGAVVITVSAVYAVVVSLIIIYAIHS
jgi:hypothetical protein